MDHYTSPRIVDIASGTGAVIECANSAFGQKAAEFTCVDISAAAIATLKKRFPGIRGFVADARCMPLDSAGYDVVTSQFGIEYAGLDAIGEVARLCVPGGRLVFLLHHRHGGIYRQCAASLSAIRKMLAAEFFPRCISMFEEGFAAGQGGDRGSYEAAARDFSPALRAVESILRHHGTAVADGTIIQLYRDIRTMHQRMQHYEAREVLDWLHGMQREIDAYAGRMASMCDAAIDATGFERLCSDLQDLGYSIETAEALVIPDRNVPLAWKLLAELSE